MKENISNMTPKQIAIKWIEVYNTHNPDTASSLYDENVSNTQLPYRKTVQGREVMKKTYENILAPFQIAR